MTPVARLNITPCPKPRMTKADRWRKRPSVLKFFAFRDAVRQYKESKVVLQSEYDAHHLEFESFEFEFHVAMPKSWDGGNITFSAYWVGLASTDGVAWGLQVKALGDGEDINVAYGTAVVVTDDSQGSATEINVSATSGTIACSGAAGDILFCQILRDVSDGNDDMAGDARLVGIKINYTTSAATDA